MMHTLTVVSLVLAAVASSAAAAPVLDTTWHLPAVPGALCREKEEEGGRGGEARWLVKRSHAAVEKKSARTFFSRFSFA